MSFDSQDKLENNYVSSKKNNSNYVREFWENSTFVLL